jgi:hypothetical protein
LKLQLELIEKPSTARHQPLESRLLGAARKDVDGQIRKHNIIYELKIQYKDNNLEVKCITPYH